MKEILLVDKEKAEKLRNQAKELIVGESFMGKMTGGMIKVVLEELDLWEEGE